MKYWQSFDIAEEWPVKDALYMRKGGRIVCKPRRRVAAEYTDKQFRRQLLLFITFGIGMYAAIVIALGAFGVA